MVTLYENSDERLVLGKGSTNLASKTDQILMIGRLQQPNLGSETKILPNQSRCRP